jgi:F0F1-type ATP synthase assembly protein I
MKNEKPKGESSLGAQIMMASELGSSIVALTVAGYFGGAWLDGHFNWSPYGVIAGISTGFALGIAFVLKRSADMDKKA